MTFQVIFANTMYLLISIVLLIVIVRLIRDKIKYGVFFEEDRPKQTNNYTEEQDEAKGCGKMFYKRETVGDRRSGHECCCGNNKWDYLCKECEVKKE